MASSTVIKKLLIAAAGTVLIAQGATDKAEAFTFNGLSLAPPLNTEASMFFGRFAAETEPELVAIAPVGALPIALGGSWYEFSFGQVGQDAQGCAPADPFGPPCTPSDEDNSVFAGSSPWEFEVPAPGAILKVTDAFYPGDIFHIFNFDTLIGTTATPSVAGSCGSNPETCFADAFVSKAAFNLTPGQYSLRILPKASPFRRGAAYFRLDPVKEVPEPLSVLGLLAFGAVAVAKRRHQ